jgi:hypothetical protein
MHGAQAHPDALGDFRPPHPFLGETADFRRLGACRRSPTAKLALGLRLDDTAALPLQHDFALELRDRADDVVHCRIVNRVSIFAYFQKSTNAVSDSSEYRTVC